MFDSIYFTCPRCDARIEVQSKAGKCVLADISQDEVPAAIAADIAGERANCKVCDRTYTVVSLNQPPTVVMRLA